MATMMTVGQVNNYIKGLFGNDFVLTKLTVKGEISECKYHPSGHIYFTLKDETGVLKCVMFASDRGRLDFQLEVGSEVSVSGRIGVYERQGSYQLYAHKIERSGSGELYARYEALKKKLEEQGMFDEIYKHPLPEHALTVGVVTAGSGAAIRDIMNISKRRNPYVRLILTPVIVQGEEAPASIVAGIERIQQLDVDVIIVGRGGGSMEDLWAFNDERVAQAIFDCPIPVISAVGHESDTTIADYVADLRAPTPSAAAELAVFDYIQFSEYMHQTALRMRKAVQTTAARSREALQTRQMRLAYLHPKTKIDQQKKDLRQKAERMSVQWQLSLGRVKQRLALSAQRMGSLSPQAKIDQGYAFLARPDGRPVRSINSIKQGDVIRAHVSDGWIDATVDKLGEEKRYG